MPRNYDINENVEKIVYLDQDFTTFEYFLTGKYQRPEKIDLEAYLQAEIKAKRAVENGQEISDDLQRFLNSYEKPLMQCEQTPFYNQLCGLKDKISLFRDVFYAKKPKYEEGWNPDNFK